MKTFKAGTYYANFPGKRSFTRMMVDGFFDRADEFGEATITIRYDNSIAVWRVAAIEDHVNFRLEPTTS